MMVVTVMLVMSLVMPVIVGGHCGDDGDGVDCGDCGDGGHGGHNDEVD